MSYALLTHTQKDAGASPITTTAIDTTGATLIVAVLALAQGSASFSDSQSNNWFQTHPVSVTGTDDCFLMICFNPITSASHTFTLNAGNFPSMAVASFSGAPGATQKIVRGITAGSTLTMPSVTPSTNGALWIAGVCGGHNASLSIDSGLTIAENAGGTNGQKVGLAYLVQGTAGALTPQWTYGSTVLAGVEVVILAGGGGGGSSGGSYPFVG